MGPKKGRMKELACRGRKSRRIGRESISLVREIPCLSSSSSAAGMEARIQTGALPAVGWSVLFGSGCFVSGTWYAEYDHCRNDPCQNETKGFDSY